MSKLTKIEKIYGKDFGVKNDNELVKYLKKVGYVNLAKLLRKDK